MKESASQAISVRRVGEKKIEQKREIDLWKKKINKWQESFVRAELRKMCSRPWRRSPSYELCKHDDFRRMRRWQRNTHVRSSTRKLLSRNDKWHFSRCRISSLNSKYTHTHTHERCIAQCPIRSREPCIGHWSRVNFKRLRARKRLRFQNVKYCKEGSYSNFWKWEKRNNSIDTCQPDNLVIAKTS